MNHEIAFAVNAEKFFEVFKKISKFSLQWEVRFQQKLQKSLNDERFQDRT